MATPQTAQRMTAAEFLDTYPTQTDTELWDGVVVEGEVPRLRHEATLIWLYNTLHPWVRGRGGRLWTNADLQLGPRDVRRPDLMAWWSGQPCDLDRAFTATPDLVIEVISPLPRDVRRDREEKLHDYCAHGIPHYWTVEPLHRVLEVYLRQWTRGTIPDWQYKRILAETRGIISPPAGPILDLDALWASVEE